MITDWITSPRRPPRPRRLRRHGRRWPLAALALLPAAAFAGWQLATDRGGLEASVVPFDSVPEDTTDDPVLGDEPVLGDDVVFDSTDPTEPAPPTTQAVVVTTPSGVGVDVPEGERTTDARCWMILIDESGSMGSADPAETRADAVDAAAGFLSAHGLEDDQIGAAWFANQAEVHPPGPPAAVPSRQPGAVAIGMGTNVSQAVEQTLAAMDEHCAATDKVLVIVSDGAASSRADFVATRDAITTATDLTVHMIATNAGGAFEPSRAFWEDPELGLASLLVISSFNSGEMSPALATILSAETGQQIGPS